MALRIIHVKFLVIVAALVMMVAAVLARETFPVGSPAITQDSDTIREEVLHNNYGSWNPPPKAGGATPGPVPDHFRRSRRSKT